MNDWSRFRRVFLWWRGWDKERGKHAATGKYKTKSAVWRRKEKANSMRKNLVGIAVCLLAFSVGVAYGANPKSPADQNGLSKGNTSVNQLYLYEKVPQTAPGDWAIVPDGAWGKMTYNTAKGTVVFNGHGLVPGTEYALLEYVDPWPGTMEVVAVGTANNGGNVNMSADYAVKSLVKYWLVPTEDLNTDGTAFIAWNPTEYLFEAYLTP